jgi:hypothetical protein
LASSFCWVPSAAWLCLTKETDGTVLSEQKAATLVYGFIDVGLQQTKYLLLRDE